jgi:hypothetical protein
VRASEPKDTAKANAATLDRLLEVAKSYNITTDDDAQTRLELVNGCSASVLRSGEWH